MKRKIVVVKHFSEAWERSFAKAVSYRIIILVLDATFVFYLTGKLELAAAFVLVSNFYSTIAYFAHERVWDKVKWGKTTAPRKRSEKKN